MKRYEEISNDQNEGTYDVMSTEKNAEQMSLIIGCSHAWVTRERPPSPHARMTEGH